MSRTGFNGYLEKVDGGFRMQFPEIISNKFLESCFYNGDYYETGYAGLIDSINKLTTMSELYFETGSLESIQKLKDRNNLNIEVALKVRERYNVPLMFTLKRLENEMGRVIKPYADAMKEKHNPISVRKKRFVEQHLEAFSRAIFKYYTRQYNGKEFAESLLPLVTE